jgi:tetratricopeptide (TPR) repeat protein
MKPRNTALALAVLVLVPVTFGPGCQSQGDSQLLGAGIGAVAGGLGGRAISGKGNRTLGTVVGAVVGGVAGYVIGGQFGENATPEQQKNPHFVQATNEFDAGMQARQAGDSNAALQHYTTATQLAPEQPEPYNNAGLIYLEQGDRANAEAMFRKALAADPNYEPARTNLRQMGVTP